ncbi:MAG: T9SS type A sorting domain-containing protein, partial [candidate division WOR-3 bacterium]
WFDDIGIIEWEPWQEFVAPAKVVEPYDYYWVQVRTDLETEYGAIEYYETVYGPPVATRTRVPARPIRELRAAPNPAHRSPVIVFELARAGLADLKVYNVLGQEVSSLVHGFRSPGRQTVEWDRTDNSGRRVGPGTYFCRLSAGRTERTLKLVLTR